jgi:hypothetical protein
VVDDSDPAIQYSGSGWFRDNRGSLDGVGNFGPTYLHTVHGTNSSDSLSFSFHGGFHYLFALLSFYYSLQEPLSKFGGPTLR